MTKLKILKTVISFLKFLIYSNIFVAFCVVAFTHLTYILYDLPTTNIAVVLLMVFSFTFFTYNSQRLYRLNKKLTYINPLGERLTWVKNNQLLLIIFSIIGGLVGLTSSFFLNPYCFLILIPMGTLTAFYVLPIIPFYKKSPTLRDLPYLKIFIIGLVWSFSIVLIPFIDSEFNLVITNNQLFIAILQNFLFVVAITLPFDIRDIDFDKKDNLKTIPRLVGIKSSIVLAIILLSSSVFLLYNLPISVSKFYALFIGHIITMGLIMLTNNERKELFFAGWIEGTVLILYCCIILLENYSFL